jgi:hypothetical protein
VEFGSGEGHRGGHGAEVALRKNRGETRGAACEYWGDQAAGSRAAAKIQTGIRQKFQKLFADGYTVTGFETGAPTSRLGSHG